jgi:hypothetical protein
MFSQLQDFEQLLKVPYLFYFGCLLCYLQSVGLNVIIAVFVKEVVAYCEVWDANCW